METNELPNNARIVHDDNVRVVQFSDDYYGLAAMTRKGMGMLARMEKDGQLDFFDISYFDGVPFMAIERKEPRLQLVGESHADI